MISERSEDRLRVRSSRFYLWHRINEEAGAEEGNILEWLSSKDIKFSSLQNTSQQTHTAGTGQWLLDGEQFQNWRDRSPGLLWLHGAGETPPLPL